MSSTIKHCWQHFQSVHRSLEKEVGERVGSYKDLSFEALYTPLDDLLQLLSHPLVRGTFVDLGCGPGFAALAYGVLHPSRSAIGVDFELARIKQGLFYRDEIALENVRLFHMDLMEAVTPVGDTYFLYFPTGPVLDKVLSELYEKGREFRLLVIESHGDLFPRLELENWLDLRGEVPLASKRHHPCARLYERSFVPRDPELLPFQTSYRELFVLCEAGTEEWVGETFGLEWLRKDEFNLQHPPRTIRWGEVKKMLELKEFPEAVQKVIGLRRKGPVKIKTEGPEYSGWIRKIIISPVFALELSCGAKVEWSKILTITQDSRTCFDSSA